MKKPTVYVALQQFCGENEAPLKLLTETGFNVKRNTLGRRLKREELPEILAGADAVLAGLEPYDAKTLAALPKLRCISRCGVGTDSIDLEAAKRRGIAVRVTREETIEPVAQMTVAMILALARNFPMHYADFHAGLWVKRTGCLISDWTIGLVGFGRIGRCVAALLHAFGARILLHDPRFLDGTLPPGTRSGALEDLLSGCDLISLHADSRAQDGPLLGKKEFAAMKKGAYLVNTARGHLVDEKALYEALKSGHLAAAAIDVYTAEPYEGDLAKLPQVLATPHVSTLTRSSRAAMELSCARNVVEFFQKK
ncbi:MAG: hypothetical protein A3J74_01240 [Elusimicrobia bacterium RIFCSPHIGHO2_02_FULL_57_9]|nr:MAG: hypothetical protein A3J74_01240 [Elusimicrobia bacterium RIFCSPHIGHO2_02_FULL_57_9]